MSEEVKFENQKTKEEKFKENPDSFVCLDEIVIAVRRTDKGLAHYIGESTRIELEAGLSRLQYNVFKAFDQMAIDKMRKESNGAIITSNGRIPNPKEVKFPPFK